MYTIFCLCVCLHTDLITDGCESPCGCQELNSGPCEEQAMLLTTEPSLQLIVIEFSQFFRMEEEGALGWILEIPVCSDRDGIHKFTSIPRYST